MPAMSKETKQNLKMQAYTILKEKLVTCEYPPGSMLNESQLAAELNFSRTPIREAISILETDGFLNILPKKGILVTDILLNDVAQIFQARIELEPITVRLGGPNMSKEEIRKWIDIFEAGENSVLQGYKADMGMHLSIIEHCNNTYIINMMKNIFDKNTRVVLTSTENKQHLIDARREHLEILNLLLEEKFEEASAKMRTHVIGCRNAALDYYYSV